MGVINQSPPGQSSVDLSAIRFWCGIQPDAATVLQIHPPVVPSANVLSPTVPQLIDWRWYGVPEITSARILTLPDHRLRDLFVAVLMWTEDSGAIIPPPGWTFHGRYLSELSGVFGTQWLYVYSKTASLSDPASYTWFSAEPASNSGLIVSVDRGAIDAVTEAYGNGPVAAIQALDARLNLCVFSWLLASSTNAMTLSVTGLGVLPILRSPAGNARLSAGYTRQAGQVTAFHSGITTATPPNHGAINIQIA